MKLKLSNRRRYPYIFILGCVLAAVVAVSSPDDRWIKVFLSIAGAFCGLTYFLYAQHAENTRLFTDLFRYFNERYDGYNGDLNKILNGDKKQDLTEDEICKLFDYFNLCAEEFLYYQAGYIDDSVWRSWTNGMRVFAADARIEKLWKDELKTASYYGFTIPQPDLPNQASVVTARNLAEPQG